MYTPLKFLNANVLSFPNKAASVHGDTTYTWAEFKERITRLAGSLQSMGIQKGDRVAMLALNGPRYLEYYFAVWWSGAAVVPMNTRWSAPENAYALKDAGARVLFVDDAFAPMVPVICEEYQPEAVIFTGYGEAPADTLDYESLITEGTPCEDAGCSNEDLAGLYYTGGTTGFPKGVMVSHQALWFNNMSSAQGSTFLTGDVYLHAAPMFHMADGAFSGAATTGGCTHVFLPMFDPVAVMDIIEKHQVTHTVMVPTMLGMLAAHPEFDPARLSSLRYSIYGASPMPEGLMKTLLERMPDVEWIQGYGQTEMAPIITLLPAAYHTFEGEFAGKLRSAGRPATGVEIKICDDDGNELPIGEVGEIVARSPGAMTGYWNKSEQTASTLKDGWVNTGDGAYRDQDGFIFIVDRLKDMIVTGGENVFSAEVESAVSTHPAVEGVAVIGIPDEKWGESVHAIVILKQGASTTEAELLEHTKPLIANYKQPRSFTFRTEPFPLSGAGKVLKTELRKPFWEGQDRSVS